LRKTALVVDDSKTARNVLRKILETHDLDVATAESAEDAIEYLSDSRPDIIFMDHEMPGMDGLEAVSTIKDNPATATIPIMMYTAQQGELYVGQARALGAIGVLPKQLEPVEVSKVLESLRIIGEDAESREQRDRVDAEVRTGEYPGLDQFDQDLREMIRNLFDQQREILRRELEDSQELIARRVADRVRPQRPEEQSQEAAGRSEAPSYALHATAGVLGILALIFALLFWYREDSWRDLQRQNADLQRVIEERQASASQDSFEVRQQLTEYRMSLDEATMVALNSLEWAANQSSHYGFNEVPMGDYRLSVLQEMSNHIAALDNRGELRIESHVGNFCRDFGGPLRTRCTGDARRSMRSGGLRSQRSIRDGSAAIRGVRELHQYRSRPDRGGSALRGHFLRQYKPTAGLPTDNCGPQRGGMERDCREEQPRRHIPVS
jgi:CheY-like chemotaxis protein